MELVFMRPEELRDAVSRNLPLLWPVGAMEYHGEHMPLGTGYADRVWAVQENC